MVDSSTFRPSVSSDRILTRTAGTLDIQDTSSIGSPPSRHRRMRRSATLSETYSSSSSPLAKRSARQSVRRSFFAPLRSTAKRISKRVIRPRQRVKGQLTKDDGVNGWLNSYVDDYVLRRVRPGQKVEVTMSAEFNGYLQLLDARTGRELLFGDDTSHNINPRMVFVAQPGAKYRIRVSSYQPRRTGNYSLRTRTFDKPTENFDFFYGYGLANAAAAVAQATGQSVFNDVPDLGGDAWSVDLIKAPEVWAQGFTGKGVKVAVIDSGIDYTHPELVDKIWTNPGEIAGNGIDDDGNGFIDDIRGWNFVTNTNDPFDDAADGHGTHVTGTIAAANDGVGITGVAYDATIMPIKVLNRRGLVNEDVTLAQAINYAVINGAKIISMSIGGDPDSGVDPELETALRLAREAGVLTVISSGNERQDLGALKSGDPAFFTAVRDWGMIVGGVDQFRRMYIDSNPAGAVPVDFVVAPAVSVRSTIPGAIYDSYDGTSMATPHVAGIAALMLSANPNLTPNEIEAILTATADRQGIQYRP